MFRLILKIGMPAGFTLLTIPIVQCTVAPSDDLPDARSFIYLFILFINFSGKPHKIYIKSHKINNTFKVGGSEVMPGHTGVLPFIAHSTPIN